LSVGGSPAGTADPLDTTALQSLAVSALDRWSAAGLASSTMDAMRRVNFVIADLPASGVALLHNNTIYVDRTAAGHGWFVDATPGADEEYDSTVVNGARAALDPAAVDRVDLLSVVFQELGHAALDLNYDTSHLLVSGQLNAGFRVIPDKAAIDAALGLM
jgi:hypothetical protein